MIDTFIRIIKRIFQIVLTVVVIFGMSLIIIPVVGIVSGLVKRWLA